MRKPSISTVKKLASYVFYIALSVAILWLVLHANDVDEIFTQLSKAKIGFIWAAIGCVIGYLALYPLSLCILTHARKCRIPYGATYSIAMTEHFFNSITPFSTGGQPFQIYSFAKARVKPAESTCLLLMNFMVFMLVTNGFAACSLFFCRRFINAQTMHIAYIAIIGFTLNFCVLLMTFLLATNKPICRLICKILDFICKIGFLKKLLSPKAESMKLYFVQVQDAFSHLMKRKGHFFLALVSKIFSMGFLYAATFFILKALNVNIPANDLLFVMCGTSFAITMVVFMPTPGSSGGIEPAFKDVFSTIIQNSGSDPSAIAAGAMLIWRLLTYYMVMGISFLFYIGLEIYLGVKSKKLRAEDCRHTYSDAEISAPDGLKPTECHNPCEDCAADCGNNDGAKEE